MIERFIRDVTTALVGDTPVVAKIKTFESTDSNGNVVQSEAVVQVDSDGRQIVRQGVAIGQVATNLGQLAIRATTYTEPSAQAQRSIVSSSANDTLAGTGAQRVRLTYYNTLLQGPFTEEISLNGVAPVNTVAANIRFIESIEVIQVGATGANVGTISLMTGLAGAGTVIWSVGVTNNAAQTLGCHHYVAANATGYIESMEAGIQSGAASQVLFKTQRPLDIGGGVAIRASCMYRILASSISTTHLISPAMKVIGPSRIDLLVNPDAATAGTIHAQFSWQDRV